MAIPQSQYVAINSVVGGATQIPGRQYIARVFTDNPILPPQTYVQFPNAAAVGAYFGFMSQEYLRAVQYFNFVSKSGTSPTLISYGRWVDVAVAPMVFGYIGTVQQNFSQYVGITNGAIGVTLNNVSHNFNGLNFSAAVDLDGVAAVLQTDISGVFAGSTVVFNPSTGNFILTAGAPGAGTVSIQAGTGGTNLSTNLNWLPAAVITAGQFFPGQNIAGLRGATTAPGSAVETPVQAVTTSAGFSTNFGSFNFMPSQLSLVLTAGSATVPASNTGALYAGMSVEGVGIPAGTAIGVITANTSFTLVSAVDLTTPVPATVSGTETLSFYLSLAQAIAVATWNDSQNVEFIYQLSVNSGNVTTWQAGLLGIGGVGISLESGTLNEYIEMLPMSIQAATNYNNPNSVVTYEFQQQAGINASVTTLSSALAYNSISVNYYGQTQAAGQLINFYQQGVLQGGAQDPIDMGIYANEIWLKDTMGAAFMNLLLAVNQVPANNSGRTQMLANMQPVINQALNNGTIEVGKTLTPTQIVYIGEITNDTDAWYQVQNQGYWRDIVITPQNTTPITYAAVYTLVYSKDDVIRKVIGTDVLI